MYEQDYILRIIRELIRTLIKLLFHIDTEKATDEILEEQNSKEILELLLEMVEEGKINEAENQIYMMMEEEKRSKETIKIALLFYSYLNEKNDDFLISHFYSREEIKEGLQNVAQKCGVSEVTKLY